MQKIKMKNIPFKLKGKIIKKHDILKFKSLDQKNEIFEFENKKNIKFISSIPSINTKVCDIQTKKFIELSQKNPQILFLTITMNTPEQIQEWCIKNNFSNVFILSDKKYQEFANKTNIFIPKLKMLSRSLIILNENNEIVDLFVNEEITKLPDFQILENFLS